MYNSHLERHDSAAIGRGSVAAFYDDECASVQALCVCRYPSVDFEPDEIPAYGVYTAGGRGDLAYIRAAFVAGIYVRVLIFLGECPPGF